MNLAELLPAARQLPAKDKLRLIRILAEELDEAEDIYPFEPHKVYHLPTPYNLFGAGHQLQELLDGITEDNLHQEVGVGTAVGNEVW